MASINEIAKSVIGILTTIASNVPVLGTAVNMVIAGVEALAGTKPLTAEQAQALHARLVAELAALEALPDLTPPEYRTPPDPSTED